MWTLVKTELSYTKFKLLIMMGFMTFLFILAAVGDNWDVEQYLSNSCFMYLIVMGTVGSKLRKESHDRLYAQLPIPLRRVALVKLVYYAIALVPVAVTWLLFMLASPDGFYAGFFWQMIATGTGVFAAISTFILHRDLGFYFTWRYRILLWIGVVVVLLILVFVLVWKTVAYLEFVESPGGALTFSLLCIAIVLTRVRVFQHRKSFVR